MGSACPSRTAEPLANHYPGNGVNEPVAAPAGTHVVSIRSVHETLDKNGSGWRIQIGLQYR